MLNQSILLQICSGDTEQLWHQPKAMRIQLWDTQQQPALCCVTLPSAVLTLLYFKAFFKGKVYSAAVIFHESFLNTLSQLKNNLVKSALTPN